MCLTFSPAESAQGQEAWGPRQAAERASCLGKKEKCEAAAQRRPAENKRKNRVFRKMTGRTV